MAEKNFRIQHGLRVGANTILTSGANVAIGGGGLPGTDVDVVKTVAGGAMICRLYNQSTASNSRSILQLNVGGTKYVNIDLNYDGNYLFESTQGGIVNRYFDYDTYYFRNSDSTKTNLFIVNNGIIVSSGNTLNRPAATSGTVRYNTDETKFEVVVGGAWDNVVTDSTNLKVYDSANTQLFP